MAPVKPRNADALTRPCPTCNAQPDQPCHTATGTQTNPHATRRKPPNTPPPIPGRTPALLNPKVQKRLLARIRKGVAIHLACQAAGIHKANLYRWLQEAEDPTAPQAYRDFRDDLLRARAEGAARLIERIDDASRWNVKSERPVIITQGPNAGVVYDADGEPLKEVTWERDWKAAAWLVERQFPTEYGRREQVALEVGQELEQVGSAAGVDPRLMAQVRENLRQFAEERGLPVIDGEVVEEAG